MGLRLPRLIGALARVVSGQTEAQVGLAALAGQGFGFGTEVAREDHGVEALHTFSLKSVNSGVGLQAVSTLRVGKFAGLEQESVRVTTP